MKPLCLASLLLIALAFGAVGCGSGNSQADVKPDFTAKPTLPRPSAAAGGGPAQPKAVDSAAKPD